VSIHDDQFARESLSHFVPLRREVDPDWDNVVHRARLTARVTHQRRTERSRRLRLIGRRGASSHVRRRSRRFWLRPGFVVIVGFLAVAIGSTIALGAGGKWWFFYDGAPAPTSPVAIVTTGAWEGHDWTLTAHQTRNFGVCFALTRGSDSSGQGIVMACGPAAFPPPSPAPDSSTTDQPLMTVGMNGRETDFPASVVGSISDQVTRVRIELASGNTITEDTLPAPATLVASLRFFAVALPCDVVPMGVIGLDRQDAVIARTALTYHATKRPGTGVVPLNSCG
jgi:hypothetical protein